ncbi:hypothetical protein AUJ77_00575 [Candidatus Nomurabacteria bacterium CG1_02_43_90]|uniref:Periplasmic copper-binding protein NosD beta helix domain-containing protein n=1 Tax=Candidatus Nomurabacteria bacterium CG1_02_43_90 TaxID=1805281 RepID=A0A1J4V570_9BACT|nr:MAG: hypothetical protein AUJ77_00575 [Candidatus Nomurabacteria bacterium CG1_02_43_90]
MRSLSFFALLTLPFLASASTISGVVYSDEGVTHATSTVRLVVNGTTAYSTATDTNGAYTISIVDPVAGTPITAYLDNLNGITGGVVTRFNSGNIPSLDIYQNELIVRHEDVGPLTNADIGLCDSVNGPACANPNLHMNVSGGALTVVNDWRLYLWAGKTFQPGGTVTLEAGAISSGAGGDIKWGSSTSTLSILTNNLSVGGDWDNTNNGIFASSPNQLTNFTATSTGFSLAGSMNDSNTFQRLSFLGATSSAWTIQSSLRVSATSTDALVIHSGTVTLGSSPNTNLEVMGGFKVANTVGETATFQTTSPANGSLNYIYENATTTPSCANCTISVGASSGAGSGTFKVGKNIVLELNGKTSDVGLEVESTGYTEILGSLDASDTVASVVSTPTSTTITVSGIPWAGQNFVGDFVRVSNTSSLAFGQVYNVSAMTSNSITFSAMSTSTDANPSITSGTTCATGTSCGITLSSSLLYTPLQQYIGRYVHNVTQDKYYLIANADTTAQSLTIVTSRPDSIATMHAGDSIEVVDGIRSGDTFSVVSPAHITKESGTLCTSVNGAGTGYVLGKAGSEIIVRYTDICNLGRGAANRDGIVTNANGANLGEGFTLEKSRIQSMGYRAIDFYYASNNVFPKGVLNNFINGTPNYGIQVNSSVNNQFSWNRVKNTANAISLDTSNNANNIVSNNNFGPLNSNGVHNIGANNLIVNNHLFGNLNAGIRMTKKSRVTTVAGNDIFGNQYSGYWVESSKNQTFVSNKVYANSAGATFGVADTYGDAGIVSGTRIIGDTIGSPASNLFENTSFDGGGHTVSLFNTSLVSATSTNRVARSGSITNSQSSTMQKDIAGPGTLTFDWRVGSEGSYDFIRFYINGVLKNSASGILPWTPQSFSLGAGTSTLKFVFSEDNSSVKSINAGEVDNIKLDGTTVDDFEAGTLSGWALSGNANWINTPEFDNVGGVQNTGAYLLSKGSGSTQLWGNYTLPSDNGETPQNESIEKYNYANNLWEKSTTQHYYSGTGTEDTNLDLDLSSANLSAGPYVYRASATTAGACTSASTWNVIRYDSQGNEASVGAALCGQQFTDTTNGVQVKFKIDGGTPTAYVYGNTYIFTVWDASNDSANQKTTQIMQNGNKITVALGTTLESKGGGAGVDQFTNWSCQDLSGSSWNLDATGTTTIQESKFQGLNLIAGTATMVNSLLTGIGFPVVSGTGVLNRDWYLSLHAVDKNNHAVNVPTTGSAFSLSEISASSTIWTALGGGWGTATSSASFDTGVNGYIPQPLSDGAIRIREYFQNASSTTFYTYQVNSTPLYTYDYFSSHGKYITSIGTTSTTTESVIGPLWYRDIIGNEGSLPSLATNPPINGTILASVFNPNPAPVVIIGGGNGPPVGFFGSFFSPTKDTSESKKENIPATSLSTEKIAVSPLTASSSMKTSHLFTTTLMQGSRGEEVASLQELLGVEKTSYFGALTQTALKAFQTKYNIVSSGTPEQTGFGVLGPKTRAKINEIAYENPIKIETPAIPSSSSSLSSLFSFTRNLSEGFSGEEIKALQKFLNRDADTRITQTGPGSLGNETPYFGALTQTALKAFQTKYNIVSSGTPEQTGFGVLGPKTRAKINELLMLKENN